LYKNKENGHIWTQYKKEKKIMTPIKGKLTTNSAMISKVHKGNSIVITYEKYYNSKVAHFIAKIILLMKIMIQQNFF
jgi:hypothetical protein